MEAQKQDRPFEPNTSRLASQAEIVSIPLKTMQSEILTADESLIGFEWARQCGKTWDVGQGQQEDIPAIFDLRAGSRSLYQVFRIG